MKQPKRSKTRMRALHHSELSEELAQAIASGEFPVRERFPTEQELQKQFGVGRHTVREALKTLTDQGLLIRKRKVGTTVVGNRPRTQYAHLIRDMRGLLDFAGNTELEIMHIGMVTPGKRLGEVFQEESDTRWLRTAGARYTKTDRKPLCWSEIYVPECFPLDREKIRAKVEPIYEYCRSAHNLRLDHVEQEIRASLLTAEIAEMLDAKVDDAALIVVRKYLDDRNRVFEVSINIYPAERYTVKSIIRQKA